VILYWSCFKEKEWTKMTRKESKVIPMKKIIKITSYGNYPQYVHAAYDKERNVVCYFLLDRIRTAAPIDLEDVKRVMGIAKAQAFANGLHDVHARAIDYKPKK
jgi:hypothetical protein